MQNYNLTCWSGDRMISYEPVVAHSAGEAIAYCQGLLTERTRHAMQFLGKMGVRYVVDHGHRRLEDLSTSQSTWLGVWHIIEMGGESTLVWQPNERDLDH